MFPADQNVSKSGFGSEVNFSPGFELDWIVLCWTIILNLTELYHVQQLSGTGLNFTILNNYVELVWIVLSANSFQSHILSWFGRCYGHVVLLHLILVCGRIAIRKTRGCSTLLCWDVACFDQCSGNLPCSLAIGFDTTSDAVYYQLYMKWKEWYGCYMFCWMWILGTWSWAWFRMNWSQMF